MVCGAAVVHGAVICWVVGCGAKVYGAMVCQAVVCLGGRKRGAQCFCEPLASLGGGGFIRGKHTKNRKLIFGWLPLILRPNMVNE